MSRADDIAAIFEDYDDVEIIQMDGFDDAIIGYYEPLNKAPMLVYSVDKIMEILCEEMDFDDAREHFDFNIAGSYGPVILVETP